MKKSKKDLTVQEAGRIGGYIRRQTADYSEMGKKGMASRWSTVRAAKDMIHLTWGAYFLIILRETDKHLDSLFLGKTSSNAILFNSRNSFHFVPSTNPMVFDLSRDEP